MRDLVDRDVEVPGKQREDHDQTGQRPFGDAVDPVPPGARGFLLVNNRCDWSVVCDGQAGPPLSAQNALKSFAGLVEQTLLMRPPQSLRPKLRRRPGYERRIRRTYGSLRDADRACRPPTRGSRDPDERP